MVYRRIHELLEPANLTCEETAVIGAALLADSTFQLAGANDLSEDEMLLWGGAKYAEALGGIVQAASRDPQ